MINHCNVEEKNEIDVGSIHTGKVVSIDANSCSIEIANGIRAVCFISNLAIEYVSEIKDVVKIGDELTVKVMKIDRFGKVMVSRKAVLKEKACLESDNIVSMKISPNKIRTVVGFGGKQVNKIIEETGVMIDIEEDGIIYIQSENAVSILKAVKMIEKLASDFEVELGMTYKCKVVSVMEFACFVELFPGKEAMCHVADLAIERTENIDDVVKIDDEFMVKVVKIDPKTQKIAVSRKALLMEERAKASSEIEVLKINPQKISNVVGAGGKQVNKITKDTGVIIDIESDGTIYLKSSDSEMVRAAKRTIEELATDFEVHVGETYASKVVSILDFGCFVELAPGIEAMCHISELDIERVENISDIVQVGSTLNVKVMKVDHFSSKISVSRRALLLEHIARKDDEVEMMNIDPKKTRIVVGAGGRQVNKITEATGVKIDIEKDGTIYLKSDDKSMITEAKRIIDELCLDIKVGETFNSKVVSVMDFGCFVELLPGKDGMCHISELAHERVDQVEDVVKVGDMIDVQVIKVDEKIGRITVSRKVLLPEVEILTQNCANSIDIDLEVEEEKRQYNRTTDVTEVQVAFDEENLATFKPKRAKEIHTDNVHSVRCKEDIVVGNTYTGTIVSIKEFGCFIELLPGLDGLCHISELSPDQIGKIEDFINVGEKIDVKVTRIDKSNGKITLSRTAVLRENLCKAAPDMDVMNVNPGKVRDIFGTGGKQVNKIMEETGVIITVEPDGTIYLKSPNAEKIEQAKTMIEKLTRDIEVGMNITGKVVSIMEFGAYIELVPGKIGACHISDLTNDPTKKVSDIVNVGDELLVKVIKMDVSRGKIILSRTAVLNESAFSAR